MNLKKSHTLKSSQIRVGITMGDPSGIGPAIIRKALHQLDGFAKFVVIGDEWVFSQISNINPSTTLRIDGERSRTIKNQNFKFIDLKNVPRKNFEFGKIRSEYARASIEYLDKALELMKAKQIDCLVTCPVSKEAVNKAGMRFLGHTEYLSSQTKTENFVMMLLNKQLRISLVTRHIPLNKVSILLSQDRLYKTVFITYQALKNLFSIKNPRIVICGLNPHASDNGLIGNEENQLIKPVLKRLKNIIKYIDGPLSADVAIFKMFQKEYDCAIAMYHDQALIPLKLLGPNRGVNLTLGLPFVRTSPLHGTAFDIARNPSLADPTSLIEAIKLTVRCTLNLRRV